MPSYAETFYLPRVIAVFPFQAAIRLPEDACHSSLVQM